MGAVQSVGGAATSGAGFTGEQITAAILGSIYEQHTGRQKVTFAPDVKEQTKYNAGSDGTMVLERKETKTELPPVDGKAAFSTKWEDQQVSFHEYAPEVFRELRQLDGVSNGDFLDEWNIYGQLDRVGKMLDDGSAPYPTKGSVRTAGDIATAAPPAMSKESTEAGLELGEGRSMAMFLKSKTMTYMLKTIAEQEVKVLSELLPAYRSYMIGDDKNAQHRAGDYSRHSSDNEHHDSPNNGRNVGNPDSLLMRFVTLLKVVTRKVEIKFHEVEVEAGKFEVTSNSAVHSLVGDEVGYILVFSDIFRSCDVLNERWDIKGRHPKPGKYRHFPRMEEKLLRLQEEEKKKEAPASKESNAAEYAKLITRKDKDLTRMFWITDDPADQATLPHFATLGPDAASNIRSKLCHQLTRDFHFLRDNGLMDYSILVGVRYNLPESPDGTTTSASTDTTSLRMKFALGEESHEGISEMRPSRVGSPREASPLPESPSAPHTIAHHTSVFHEGINSLNGHETYYIGIIDMLTEYTWKKMSANFFKSFLWREGTLSTIPPKKYCTRIEKFASRIFPKIVIEEDAVEVTTGATPAANAPITKKSSFASPTAAEE